MDEIFGALIGLVGACESGVKTENTDAVLLSALAAPLSPDFDAEKARETAARVRAEKFAVSPGCASCASPCGNTSDFDMERLSDEPPEALEMKRRILRMLCETAAVLQKSRARGNVGPLCRALLYMRYSVGTDVLETLCKELTELQAQAERKDSYDPQSDPNR